MSAPITQLISSCAWSPTRFLIISPNVFDHLIYYSHLLPLLTALVLGFFVAIKSRGQLAGKILAYTLGFLSIWLFSDLVVWATNNPHYTMFFWALENMVEPIVYAGVLCFIYIFIKNRNPGFKSELIIFLLLLPTIILASTKANLLGYDISNCDRDAIEGPSAYYSYFIEIIFVFWALILSVRSFIKSTDPSDRKKIALVTIGGLGFLLAFSFGNVIGSLFSNSNILGDYSWSIGQYGIFGVPIFIAFLAYLIVKYHSLNIKTFGAQVLIAALLIIVGSEFFFVTNLLNRILVSVTFVLTSIGGYLLVRSVAGEIRAREELQVANEGQENLIHIMNHQIKGYLGKARNIFAELVSEPDYCASESAKPMLTEGLKSVTEGVEFIQQVLNGSSAAKGTLTYTMKPVDFKALVAEAAEKQRVSAEEKHLAFKVEMSEGNYTTNIDEIQMKEAVKNLIDNSIRYTPTGSITVKLSSLNQKILLSIIDTGVGIADEDKTKLFTKGGRGKDSLKYNVNSTGYGLAFVKGVVEAHKGRVWAESAGAGKGSTFYLELPLIG